MHRILTTLVFVVFLASCKSVNYQPSPPNYNKEITYTYGRVSVPASELYGFQHLNSAGTVVYHPRISAGGSTLGLLAFGAVGYAAGQLIDNANTYDLDGVPSSISALKPQEQMNQVLQQNNLSANSTDPLAAKFSPYLGLFEGRGKQIYVTAGLLVDYVGWIGRFYYLLDIKMDKSSLRHGFTAAESTLIETNLPIGFDTVLKMYLDEVKGSPIEPIEIEYSTDFIGKKRNSRITGLLIGMNEERLTIKMPQAIYSIPRNRIQVHSPLPPSH